MTRLLALGLWLLALVAPAAGVQTFLAPGGVTLTTSTELQLTSLATTFTVSDTAAGYFILASIDASYPGSVANCALRVRVHNVSGDFADQSVTAPIPPGGVLRTVQVPITGVTGATFGLGSETIQVFATKTCSGQISLAESSYLLISSGGMPGGVIVSINGQTGANQVMALNVRGIGGGLVSGSNLHTFTVTTIGDGTESTELGSAADGTDKANASGNHTVSVGTLSTAAGLEDTCVGYGCVANSTQGATGLGVVASATGSFATAVGASTNASVDYGLALGTLSVADQTGCIAMAGGNCSAANQWVVGGAHNTITDLVIGKGVTAAAPSSLSIYPTSASGTNVGGASFTLAGGQPTGSGSGGPFCLATAEAGSTGTTLRLADNRWCVEETGRMTAQGSGSHLRLRTNNEIQFGNSVTPNAKMYYDGTNLRVLPKNSGSGFVDVAGTVKGTGLWLSPTPGFGLVVESAHADVPQGTRNVTSAAFSITASAESPYVRLVATGPFVLTSTPTITNGVTDGQQLLVANEDTGGDCITFQDNGTLGGSNLELCATHSTVTLCGDQDSLKLHWSGALGEWVEDGCRGPTPTVTATPTRTPTATPT